MPTAPTAGTGVDHPLAEAVVRRHDDVRRQLGLAREAAQQPGDPRSALPTCDTFVATLSEHLAAAEEVLYPAVRRRLPQGGQRVGQQMQRIRRMERALREVEASLYGDSFARGSRRQRVWDEIQAAFAEYQDAERQIARELDASVEPAAARKLADRFEGAALRAPTRPHPYSPHSRVLGGLSNRIWSIADRALDTMDNRSVPRPPPGPHPSADTRWGQYLLGQPAFEEAPDPRPQVPTPPAEEPPSAGRAERGGLRRYGAVLAGGAAVAGVAVLLWGGAHRMRRPRRRRPR